MKKTNPIFSLKNFRSFGEQGADFELAPITVLTGCNSAGKSSLVKALMLLAKNAKGESMVDLGGKRNLPSLDLKASSVDLKLGGYNRIVNTLKGGGNIELSYTIWSSFLHEEVICRRIYKVKEAVLNDGALKSFSIEKKDGTVIYRGAPSKDSVIMENGEEVFFDFVREEEHFEVIKGNYERFLLAFGYSYFAMLKNKMDANDKPEKSKFYQRVVDRIEEGKERLDQFGMTIEDANGYDIDAIVCWHKENGVDGTLAKFKECEVEIEGESEEEVKQQIYFTLVVNEIVSPWFFSRIASIDSSTNKISRIYNVEDKDKLSLLLCDIVNRTNAFKYHSNKFINGWLQAFGIGDFLEIEGTEEGLGVRVYVEKDGVRRLLADEGCGLTQIISILLQIDVLKNRYSERSVDEDFHEIMLYGKTVICIEEPEVHLHPKYQSMLADLFVEAYQKYNIHFIIETHSEYLVRKLQVMVANKENALTPSDVSLNYVEKGTDGLSTNRKIGILEDGRLSEPFGTGFFDEADNRAMELLHLKATQK